MIETLINIGAFLIGLKFALFFACVGVAAIALTISKIIELLNNKKNKGD